MSDNFPFNRDEDDVKNQFSRRFVIRKKGYELRDVAGSQFEESGRRMEAFNTLPNRDAKGRFKAKEPETSLQDAEDYVRRQADKQSKLSQFFDKYDRKRAELSARGADNMLQRVSRGATDWARRAMRSYRTDAENYSSFNESQSQFDNAGSWLRGYGNDLQEYLNKQSQAFGNGVSFQVDYQAQADVGRRTRRGQREQLPALAITRRAGDRMEKYFLTGSPASGMVGLVNQENLSGINVLPRQITEGGQVVRAVSKPGEDVLSNILRGTMENVPDPAKNRFRQRGMFESMTNQGTMNVNWTGMSPVEETRLSNMFYVGKYAGGESNETSDAKWEAVEKIRGAGSDVYMRRNSEHAFPLTDTLMEAGFARRAMRQLNPATGRMEIMRDTAGNVQYEHLFPKIKRMQQTGVSGTQVDAAAGIGMIKDEFTTPYFMEGQRGPRTGHMQRTFYSSTKLGIPEGQKFALPTYGVRSFTRDIEAGDEAPFQVGQVFGDPGSLPENVAAGYTYGGSSRQFSDVLGRDVTGRYAAVEDVQRLDNGKWRINYQTYTDKVAQKEYDKGEVMYVQPEFLQQYGRGVEAVAALPGEKELPMFAATRMGGSMRTRGAVESFVGRFGEIAQGIYEAGAPRDEREEAIFNAMSVLNQYSPQELGVEGGVNLRDRSQISALMNARGQAGQIATPFQEMFHLAATDWLAGKARVQQVETLISRSELEQQMAGMLAGQRTSRYLAQNPNADPDIAAKRMRMEIDRRSAASGNRFDTIRQMFEAEANQVSTPSSLVGNRKSQSHRFITGMEGFRYDDRGQLVPAGSDAAEVYRVRRNEVGYTLNSIENNRWEGQRSTATIKAETLAWMAQSQPDTFLALTDQMKGGRYQTTARKVFNAYALNFDPDMRAKHGLNPATGDDVVQRVQTAGGGTIRSTNSQVTNFNRELFSDAMSKVSLQYGDTLGSNQRRRLALEAYGEATENQPIRIATEGGNVILPGGKTISSLMMMGEDDTTIGGVGLSLADALDAQYRGLTAVANNDAEAGAFMRDASIKAQEAMGSIKEYFGHEGVVQDVFAAEVPRIGGKAQAHAAVPVNRAVVSRDYIRRITGLSDEELTSMRTGDSAGRRLMLQANRYPEASPFHAWGNLEMDFYEDLQREGSPIVQGLPNPGENMYLNQVAMQVMLGDLDGDDVRAMLNYSRGDDGQIHGRNVTAMSGDQIRSMYEAEARIMPFSEWEKQIEEAGERGNANQVLAGVYSGFTSGKLFKHASDIYEKGYVPEERVAAGQIGKMYNWQHREFRQVMMQQLQSVAGDDWNRTRYGKEMARATSFLALHSYQAPLDREVLADPAFQKLYDLSTTLSFRGDSDQSIWAAQRGEDGEHQYEEYFDQEAGEMRQRLKRRKVGTLSDLAKETILAGAQINRASPDASSEARSVSDYEYMKSLGQSVARQIIPADVLNQAFTQDEADGGSRADALINKTLTNLGKLRNYEANAAEAGVEPSQYVSDVMGGMMNDFGRRNLSEYIDAQPEQLAPLFAAIKAKAQYGAEERGRTLPMQGRGRLSQMMRKAKGLVRAAYPGAKPMLGEQADASGNIADMIRSVGQSLMGSLPPEMAQAISGAMGTQYGWSDENTQAMASRLTAQNMPELTANAPEQYGHNIAPSRYGRGSTPQSIAAQALVEYGVAPQQRHQVLADLVEQGAVPLSDLRPFGATTSQIRELQRAAASGDKNAAIALASAASSGDIAALQTLQERGYFSSATNPIEQRRYEALEATMGDYLATQQGRSFSGDPEGNAQLGVTAQMFAARRVMGLEDYPLSDMQKFFGSANQHGAYGIELKSNVAGMSKGFANLGIGGDDGYIMADVGVHSERGNMYQNTLWGMNQQSNVKLANWMSGQTDLNRSGQFVGSVVYNRQSLERLSQAKFGGSWASLTPEQQQSVLEQHTPDAVSSALETFYTPYEHAPEHVRLNMSKEQYESEMSESIRLTEQHNLPIRAMSAERVKTQAAQTQEIVQASLKHSGHINAVDAARRANVALRTPAEQAADIAQMSSAIGDPSNPIPIKQLAAQQRQAAPIQEAAQVQQAQAQQQVQELAEMAASMDAPKEMQGVLNAMFSMARQTGKLVEAIEAGGISGGGGSSASSGYSGSSMSIEKAEGLMYGLTENMGMLSEYNRSAEAGGNPIMGNAKRFLDRQQDIRQAIGLARRRAQKGSLSQGDKQFASMMKDFLNEEGFAVTANSPVVGAEDENGSYFDMFSQIEQGFSALEDRYYSPHRSRIVAQRHSEDGGEGRTRRRAPRDYTLKEEQKIVADLANVTKGLSEFGGKLTELQDILPKVAAGTEKVSRSQLNMAEDFVKSYTNLYDKAQKLGNFALDTMGTDKLSEAQIRDAFEDPEQQALYRQFFGTFDKDGKQMQRGLRDLKDPVSRLAASLEAVDGSDHIVEDTRKPSPFRFMSMYYTGMAMRGLYSMTVGDAIKDMGGAAEFQDNVSYGYGDGRGSMRDTFLSRRRSEIYSGLAANEFYGRILNPVYDAMGSMGAARTMQGVKLGGNIVGQSLAASAMINQGLVGDHMNLAERQRVNRLASGIGQAGMAAGITAGVLSLSGGVYDMIGNAQGRDNGGAIGLLNDTGAFMLQSSFAVTGGMYKGLRDAGLGNRYTDQLFERVAGNLGEKAGYWDEEQKRKQSDQLGVSVDFLSQTDRYGLDPDDAASAIRAFRGSYGAIGAGSQQEQTFFYLASRARQTGISAQDMFQQSMSYAQPFATYDLNRREWLQREYAGFNEQERVKETEFWQRNLGLYNSVLGQFRGNEGRAKGFVERMTSQYTGAFGSPYMGERVGVNMSTMANTFAQYQNVDPEDVINQLPEDQRNMFANMMGFMSDTQLSSFDQMQGQMAYAGFGAGDTVSVIQSLTNAGMNMYDPYNMSVLGEAASTGRARGFKRSARELTNLTLMNPAQRGQYEQFEGLLQSYGIDTGLFDGNQYFNTAAPVTQAAMQGWAADTLRPNATTEDINRSLNDSYNYYQGLTGRGLSTAEQLRDIGVWRGGFNETESRRIAEMVQNGEMSQAQAERYGGMQKQFEAYGYTGQLDDVLENVSRSGMTASRYSGLAGMAASMDMVDNESIMRGLEKIANLGEEATNAYTSYTQFARQNGVSGAGSMSIAQSLVDQGFTSPQQMGRITSVSGQLVGMGVNTQSAMALSQNMANLSNMQYARQQQVLGGDPFMFSAAIQGQMGLGNVMGFDMQQLAKQYNLKPLVDTKTGLGIFQEEQWQMQRSQHQMQYQEQMRQQQLSEHQFGMQAAGLYGGNFINPATGQLMNMGIGSRALEDRQIALGYRQQDYNFSVQMEENRRSDTRRRESISVERQQNQRQYEWQVEDWQRSENMNQLQFGWQMEDFDENLKFARGRDRRQMLRQRDRAVISENIRREGSDAQRDRIDEQRKWQQEADTRQEKYFEEDKQFRDQQLQQQRKFYEEGKQYSEQERQMSRMIQDINMQVQQQELAQNRQLMVFNEQIWQREFAINQEIVRRQAAMEMFYRVTWPELMNSVSSSGVGAAGSISAAFGSVAQQIQRAMNGLSSQLAAVGDRPVSQIGGTIGAGGNTTFNATKTDGLLQNAVNFLEQISRNNRSNVIINTTDTKGALEYGNKVKNTSFSSFW